MGTTSLIKLWKILNPLGGMLRTKVQNGIYSNKEFHEILERERSRIDRNGHSFSLIIFDVGNTEENGAYSKRLVKTLHSRGLRVTDEIGWFDKRHIGVVLHNIGTWGVKNFIDNIRETIDGEYRFPDCEVYVYPSDDSEDMYSEDVSSEEYGHPFR